jgi:hypothetical protein
MARETLTVVPLELAGVDILYTGANYVSFSADGHAVPVDHRHFVAITNASGAPRTFTIQTPGNVDGEGIAEATRATTAGQTWYFAIRPVERQSDGMAYIDADTHTGCSIAAFRLPG